MRPIRSYSGRMIQIQSSTILNGPSTPERTITETSALRQTMPVHPIAPFFTPAAVALLRAAGANAGLSGIAHALPIIVSCVHAAAELWPNEPLKEWAEVTTEMARDFSVAKSTAAGISPEFFNRPENATKIFEQFISWQTPALSSGSAFETHALLGRAVIQSASACHVISGELMSGLQTLARARQGKTRGSRSEDWEQLIPLIWTRSDQLKQAQLHSSKKSPVSGFLAACVSVLNAVCAGPILIGNSPSSQPENQSDDYSENDQFTSRNSEKTKAMSLSAQGTDDEDDEEGIPDIKYRLNAADWTSFSEKLGLYHRDQMLMDDLVEVTQKLPKFTKNGSLKEKGFAVLATLSLVTGCTDTVALQLQLHPMHSIWLDLSRGSWAWDFSVYRESKGHLIEPGSIEPIFCAWPSFLDPLLNAAVRQCPEAKTLEDLVLSIQDKEHFDLKSYRQFLRTWDTLRTPLTAVDTRDLCQGSTWR